MPWRGPADWLPALAGKLAQEPCGGARARGFGELLHQVVKVTEVSLPSFASCLVSLASSLVNAWGRRLRGPAALRPAAGSWLRHSGFLVTRLCTCWVAAPTPVVQEALARGVLFPGHFARACPLP